MNREGDEKYGAKERSRTALDRYPQNEDEGRLIRLESAMPSREPNDNFRSPVAQEASQRSRNDHSRELSRNGYNNSNQQPSAKVDNSKRGYEDEPKRVSAYLEDKSRIRSTSMYDARPLAEKKEPKQQERPEVKISEEKRRQIEQGII